MLSWSIIRSRIPKRWFTPLLVVVLVVANILALYMVPTDPDLGWHLRAGAEILARNQIPRVDWFSHTMTNFAWIDHEWLINIVMYWVNAHLGIVVLNLLFIAVVFATFVIFVPKAALRKISKTQALLFMLLVAPLIRHFFGIRPQILSWLFLAMLLAAIAHVRQKPQSKMLYAIPLIMVMWANLHGSFALGLAVLGIVIFTEGLKAFYFKTGGSEVDYLRRDSSMDFVVWKKFVLVSVIAAAVTLANPYGIGIYQEFLRTVTDNSGTRSIAEWLPPDFRSSTGIFLFVFIVAVLEMLYLQFKRKIDFTEFVLLLAFLFLALSSVRNIPLFIIVMLPSMLATTKGLYRSFKAVLAQPLLFGSLSIIGLCAFLQFGNFLGNFPNSLTLDRALQANYPVGVAQYLQKHPGLGKMYNEYNIGGFLVYAAPSYPVFIDGRMVHWRTKSDEKIDGRPAIGTQIFKDFQWIDGLKADWDKRIDDYDIDFAIVSSGSNLDYALRFNSTWQRVYRDQNTIIYKHTK